MHPCQNMCKIWGRDLDIKTIKEEHSPYQVPAKIIGGEAQSPIKEDIKPILDDEGIKLIKQIVGVYLYYARAMDDTLLPALRAIASKQITWTKKTL